MKINLLIFLILCSSSIFAISEINYEENYPLLVLPILDKLKSNFFVSNGKSIHYQTLNMDSTLENNCIVILPGRAEFTQKYAELIYDLSQAKIGAHAKYFLLDHRGQGSSDRFFAPHDIGYVDHFENYVSDFNFFLKSVVNQSKCRNKFLVAHSMGGAIALLFLKNNPSYFDKVVLSSPMVKITSTPFPYTIAKKLIRTLVHTGFAQRLSFGEERFNFSNGYEENDDTNSIARYLSEETLLKKFPKAQLGGASNQWVYEVMNATDKLRKHFEKIETPLLVFMAENEKYVSKKEIASMCTKAKNCSLIHLKNSRHEVFNETDSIRDIAIEHTLNFLGSTN